MYKRKWQSSNPRVVKCNTSRYQMLSFSFEFYSLRHTRAPLFLENRAKIKEISELLRHNRISITIDTYFYVTKKNESVAIIENLKNDS